MVYPKSLLIGDRIAIVSPSGEAVEEYVLNAKKILEGWGLEVILSPHVLGRLGRFSGTIEERLQDLQAALDDPTIQAILCSRGGYGAVHLLEKMDWTSFRKSPKWFMGYSDITALHNVISGCGICSVHSLMSSHLSEEGEDESSLFLKGILFGERPTYKILPHELNRKGSVKGFTRGGNVSVFHGLRGTQYDLIMDDTILFIEDIGEKPYQIERMMYNLKLGGILSRISGLIVGQFTEYEEDPLMNASLYELISQLVSEYNYPVAFNFPIGHIKENFPLIESGEVIFKVTDSEVTLSYQ